MFSKEFQELDLNTVKFMIEEKVKELVEKNPEFRYMYQENYDICENVE